jgi:hypothetical protein
MPLLINDMLNLGVPLNQFVLEATYQKLLKHGVGAEIFAFKNQKKN